MPDPKVARYDAILGLGSNMGDKAANIIAALRELDRQGDVRIVARSRLYRSKPWGVLDQDWFVNACASVATQLPPHALLDRCLAVETDMGRVRVERWGPRIIDIDVLDYRGLSLTDERLKLPHPGITERAFVLAPLADIAPRFEIGGRPVADWLAAADRRGVDPIAEPND